MEKLVISMKRFGKTLLWFAIGCFLIPVLLFSFICVHYLNRLNKYVLGLWYPKYTISHSKKIRTLIDTQRNAGIFHFLLQVQGKCNFDLIKENYRENLTDACFKSGELKFPKLKQQLVARWGHYAWVKDTSTFNINNHVLLSSQTYRGRTVNDGNIEGFVSDLVTKYIPSDIPQWQVIVIPTSRSENKSDDENDQGEHFYILVKIHHLFIAEEEELHISDILMLKEKDSSDSKDKLSPFVEKPKHVSKLLEALWKAIVQMWNEFIYEFESLETPDGSSHSNISNITHLLSLLIIIPVNTVIKYWKVIQLRKKYAKHRLGKPNSKSMRSEIIYLLKEEIEHRQLTLDVAKRAIYSSLLPTNIIKNYLKIFWAATLIPYQLYFELIALRDVVFNGGKTTATKTYCKKLADNLPLVINALKEFISICYEIFKAPVNIYEELFEHRSREPNYLHFKTYSGRKIVSFTKSLQIETHHLNGEINESDFRLACLAASIHDYFDKVAGEVRVPRILNTTCRTFVKNYFTNHTSDKTDFIGGVVFLKLPLRKPEREHVEQIHSIVDHIKAKQLFVYLTSIGQTKFDLISSILPRVVTKIFINYFSSNFPVTITEISGPNNDFELLWGQQVKDVLLFRPPQSKTCLSLNMHTFGNRCRLAVMADTQLGPRHAIIARSFENYVENYAPLKET